MDFKCDMSDIGGGPSNIASVDLLRCVKNKEKFYYQ